MISVKIFVNEDGMIDGYAISGHSGTATRGQDMHRAVTYDIASGNLRVRLSEPPDERSEAILRTMWMGLAEIEKISPKGIQIQEVKG